MQDRAEFQFHGHSEFQEDFELCVDTSRRNCPSSDNDGCVRELLYERAIVLEYVIGFGQKSLWR